METEPPQPGIAGFDELVALGVGTEKGERHRKRHGITVPNPMRADGRDVDAAAGNHVVGVVGERQLLDAAVRPVPITLPFSLFDCDCGEAPHGELFLPRDLKQKAVLDVEVGRGHRQRR